MATFKMSRAASIQIRVIGALLRREFLALSGKRGGRFLLQMLEPLLFIVALGCLFMFRTTIGNIPLPEFIFSGFCILWACRFHIMKIAGAYQANIPLLYHRYIKVIDLFFAKALIQAFTTTISSIVLLLVLTYTDYITNFYNPPYIILSWLLVQWYGFAFALICGSLSCLSSFGSRLNLVFGVSQVFLTASFYMVEWLPRDYREIALYSPMVNATEMMRYGFFGNMCITHFDIKYIVICNIVLTYIGLAMCRKSMSVEAADDSA